MVSSPVWASGCFQSKVLGLNDLNFAMSYVWSAIFCFNLWSEIEPILVSVAVMSPLFAMINLLVSVTEASAEPEAPKTIVKA